jgi:hypothetical protein
MTTNTSYGNDQTNRMGMSGQDVESDETHQFIASNKVEGTDVYRPGGDKIGSIDRLMIDKKSGRVAYAVMSFGGFLGMGQSMRPIPWDQLRYSHDVDGYELNVTEDRLSGAPEFQDDEDFDWSNPDWNKRMRDYYGTSSQSMDPYSDARRLT